MFSIFLLYRYIVLKLKIKAISSKLTNDVTGNGFIDEKINEQKFKLHDKMRGKLKRFKIYFIISGTIDFLIVLGIVMMMSHFMGTLSSIATISNMWDDVAVDNSDSVDSRWQWSTDNNGNGLQSSSGIYPKDPVLKQIAMFLEASEISAAEVNKKVGGNYVNPALILSVTMRETGGRIINKLVEDTSLNIYSDLIYENPACGKGSSCGYIKNGYSHFEGGYVSGGIDNIDPATQPVNTSKAHYDSAGGDHAVGYFQFENTSIDGMLINVFPIGDYASKEYTSSDRYKMDSTLGFIRPNIAYIPDNIINVAYHNGELSRYGNGLKQAWNEIQSKSWYKGLSVRDQQFVWGALKDLSYQGGSYIGYDGTKAMIATLELVATMKYDGYIDSMYDIVPFLEKYYPDASGTVSKLYNTSTHKISRPGDTVWTRAFNKILEDGSLKSNTREAAQRVKNTLSVGKFRTYAEAGNRALYADIPPKSIAWISMGQQVYDIMKSEIDAAEKDGNNLGITNPVGVSKENFKETPGIGQGMWNGKTSAELVGDSKYYRETKHMWGTSVTISSGYDPFNSLNSKFHVPYFSQSSKVGNETWSSYNTGSFNLQNAGCAVYMWAHVASALQQRLINPPEMLTVGTYFGAYQSGTGLFTWDSAAHNRLFNSFGYKVTMYSKNEAKSDGPWNDLNQALRKNIPSGYRCSNTFTNVGSHFLNIDAITDDGRYVLAQTNYTYAEQRTWSRAEIFNTMHSSNKSLFVVDKN